MIYMGKELMNIKIPVGQDAKQFLEERKITDYNPDIQIKDDFQIVEVEVYRSHILQLIESGKLDKSQVICPTCEDQESQCIIC